MKPHNEVVVFLQSLYKDNALLMPEWVLCITFLGLFVADLWFKKQRIWLLWSLFAGGLVATMIVTILQFNSCSCQFEQFFFAKMLYLDTFGVFFKLFLVGATLLTAFLIPLSPTFRAKENFFRGEYFYLIVAVLIGAYLVAMAQHLLMFYLALELISIASYLLVGFNFDKKSAEGSLKYILFGAFSSAMMLYGMSLLYGLTGTLQVGEPQWITTIFKTPTLLHYLALSFFAAGILFKLAAFPFHFWTPDIYESAPSPVVAFFSVVPKAAVLAFVFRWASWFPSGQLEWVYAVGFIAVATMLVGNLAAFWQDNIKRLLAYSSIGQAGFLLAMVLVGKDFNLSSLLFYLISYSIANFLAFALVDIFAHFFGQQNEMPYAIENYKGIGTVKGLESVAFLLAMLSLAGIPPLVGFSAKLLLYSTLWENYHLLASQWILWILFLSVFLSLVALFYYLKVPYQTFFLPNTSAISLERPSTFYDVYAKVLVLILSLALLVLFFAPNIIMAAIQQIKLG